MFFAFLSLSTTTSKIAYKLSSSSPCIERECKSKNTFSALLQTACGTEMSEAAWQVGLFVGSGFHFHQVPSQLWIPTHWRVQTPSFRPIYDQLQKFHPAILTSSPESYLSRSLFFTWRLLHQYWHHGTLPEVLLILFISSMFHIMEATMTTNPLKKQTIFCC